MTFKSASDDKGNNALTVHMDYDHVITGYMNGDVTIFDKHSANHIKTLTGHKGPVTSVGI